MKKIVLTGGGTAGHVTPNIALVPKLKESGFEIKYIGTYNGMEKQLVEDAGLDYIGISSGKLRRYFSWKNFSDPFRVLKGYFEAKKFMKKYKPDIVFSGFKSSSKSGKSEFSSPVPSDFLESFHCFSAFITL